MIRAAALLVALLAAFAATAQEPEEPEEQEQVQAQARPQPQTPPQPPERLWVADRLYLGVYGEPDNGGGRLSLLPSGERVTVLERMGNDARVRTANGTEGWVRANFLTAEMPANARVRVLDPRIAELEAENARLERAVVEAVEAAETEPAVPPAVVPDPRTERALADAEQRISELANALTDARAAAAREPEPAWRAEWPWLAGLGALLLVAGAVAGIGAFDWWARRRHGGFRIW